MSKTNINTNVTRSALVEHQMSQSQVSIAGIPNLNATPSDNLKQEMINKARDAVDH